MRARSSRILAWVSAATLITAVACADSSRTSPSTESASAPKTLPAASTGPAVSTKLEHATFAGGCFWCEETAFEGLPGVQSVTSGYTGGFQKNPTYEEVSAGVTGHAESVDIVFDPSKVTYRELLQLFWHNVDPTQANGQFCDHGNQYRSAIFYHDSTQHALALASKKAIEDSKRFDRPIVTEIVAATHFYPAEQYHQDFYKKDPVRYKTYRFGCGRDARLKEIWGQPGRQGHSPS
jgi:peptide-methionine (S)-S-oxide reductase